MKKIINSTKRFEKSLTKLIPFNREKFYKKLEIFLEDEFDVRLKTHRLKGNRSNDFSFSITNDIRVIYQKTIISNREIIVFTLFDIGMHNRVY